ncbi:MAG: hypothetical protein WD894_10105 [Pirellulales bacterium]
MKYPSALPHDTSPEAFRVQLEIYRGMSPEARLEQALQWSEQVREFGRIGIRLRHPEYSDREVQLASIRLRLGDDLFRRVYPGVDVQP